MPERATIASLASPACLFLAAAPYDGQVCELGLTLQHPPIQMTHAPGPRLSVSGARADLAGQLASEVGLTGEIELELAIPANMGLCSDGVMRACVALLAAGTAPAPDLAAQACAHGGLLLVDAAGAVRARAEIASTQEDEDWVFVLALPREPDDLSETFEADGRAAMLAAAAHLPDQRAGVDALFLAAQERDIQRFAGALAALHSAGEGALARAGRGRPPHEHDHVVIDLMRAHGALACARSLSGLGLYGLIQGGGPSRALRKALVTRLGYFGPLVMASICDNRGARIEATPPPAPRAQSPIP